MRFYQIFLLVVPVIAAFGAVADKEKVKYTALFAVAGVLFLASVVIQSAI